jgi:hypothetical protein
MMLFFTMVDMFIMSKSNEILSFGGENPSGFSTIIGLTYNIKITAL